ncbi:MAG: 4-hydroxy-tetrahydrodipicolinate reductase [Bacteroidota bacterium]|nr:4-hydroxy-tetrahydrodipicolinate reductase [Bacteroidota bacterium]
MNIAIIGYGRMGHEIESVAINRGHKINLIIDQENLSDLNESSMKSADVAIEFTNPDSAFGNVSKCLSYGTRVVSGTTGWLRDYEKAVSICKQYNSAFIHSSNFSIGVNILFRLNSELAKYLAKYPEYKPFIEEIHHVKKLDAPSGTAIALARGISGQNTTYGGWAFEKDATENKVPIRAVREGAVPGIHIVTWDSDIDILTLRHESKSRKGLATGAVVAAEFLQNRKGVFTMNDVLGF